MKPASFESLISELETIVQTLDSSVGLEESLKKYERGMELAKEAEKRLAIIENEFQKLTVKYTPPAEQSKPGQSSPDTDADLTELPF